MDDEERQLRFEARAGAKVQLWAMCEIEMLREALQRSRALTDEMAESRRQLQVLNANFAERIAAQSALLTGRAERQERQG